MKVGRNDQCPCGSGRKYKHCYQDHDSGCLQKLKDDRIKMLAEHNDREKKVFRFFNEVIEETNIILLKSEDGHDKIQSRIQMIIIFSLVDMLGGYWYTFLGQNGKTLERPKNWYNKYCATEENIHYKDFWTELNVERLYVFRNSLVHFFGLGEKYDNIYISLASNNLPDKTHKNWQEEFSKKGDKTIIIRPEDFYNLIKEGGVLMLKEWGNMIKQAQTNRDKECYYINGIERVWDKIRKEGAVRIPSNIK
ncbi:MAG: SEC-C domain-containing protein [Candidatus Buchananbacteria bacterium]